jgi:excisionase family DNA binding protein
MSEPKNDLLTPEEAAKIVRLHPKTLRRLASEGHFSAVRFGRRKLLFSRAALLASGKKNARPTAEAKAT